MGAVKSLRMDLEEMTEYFEGKADYNNRKESRQCEFTGQAREAYKLGWTDAYHDAIGRDEP